MLACFSQQSCAAGHKWLKGFLHRQKKLHPKKSKNISVICTMCTNPALTLNKFFEQYKTVCAKFQIESPLYIWNCDELSVQDVPKEEVVAVIGEKANTQVPSECGGTSTVITFANAAGNILPPLIIHNGRRVNDTWIKGAPADIMVRASQKGCINKGILHEYSLKWIQWLHYNGCLAKKNLLLLDAHKSHINNIQFLILMVCNNIEVMAIPSHTSHILQPLDSTPFVNFKTAWSTNMIKYSFTSVGCKIPKKDFWLVFWPTWKNSMTTAVLQSGFCKTFMFPINSNTINSLALGPSLAKDNVAHMQGKEMLTSWMFQMFGIFDIYCLIMFHFVGCVTENVLDLRQIVFPNIVSECYMYLFIFQTKFMQSGTRPRLGESIWQVQ